jgi:hypothetical protein
VAQWHERICDWIAYHQIRRIAIRAYHQIPRGSRRGFQLKRAGRGGESGYGGKRESYSCIVNRQWEQGDGFTVVSIRKQESSVKVTRGSESVGRVDSMEETVHVSLNDILTRRLPLYAARVWILLSTSYVTDYLAPIAVGLAPAVMWAFQLFTAHSGLR